MAILNPRASSSLLSDVGSLRGAGGLLLLQAALLLTLLPSSAQKQLIFLGEDPLRNNSSPPLEIHRHHRSITGPSGAWEWARRRHRFAGGDGDRKRPPPSGRRSAQQCLYQRFHRNTPTHNYTLSSNNNNHLQPLSKLQRVTNWINRLCSLQYPRDRLDKLLSKSPCSEYKLDICQALRPGEIANIIGSDHFACFKTVENVWKAFHHIKNTLDDFNSFLPSFDSSPYSVEFELDQCKIAYGFWICSESLPLYLTSTVNNETMPVAPCRSVCRDVEKRCPFLIRGTEDDKAAGNPTFLCRDENVPSVVLEGSSPPTKCCYEQIKDPPPGSWRSITKSSFLDPSQSCLSLLELDRSEDGGPKDPGGTLDLRTRHKTPFHQIDVAAGVSSTTAEELTACDSFYFVPSSLNVSASPEKTDWEDWRQRRREQTLKAPPGEELQSVLHYQFNLEEFFLTLFNYSSSTSSSSTFTTSGSASLLLPTSASSSYYSYLPPFLILRLQLIRTLWNSYAS